MNTVHLAHFFFSFQNMGSLARIREPNVNDVFGFLLLLLFLNVPLKDPEGN